MDLKVRTKSWSGRSYEWLKSEFGTQHMQTVTLDLDTFDFASVFTTKVIPAGVVLGKITVSGKYGPYDDAGTNEQQTVTITGTPTGGTFTLTWNGQTTGAIAYNASAATVEAALIALSNIDAGEVDVTGGPGPDTAWVVEFLGDYQGTNVAAMTATSSLTGGSSPAIAVTTNQAGVAGATDGRGTATGFLFEDVDVSALEGTDLTGEVVVPMLVTGFIRESKLPTNHGLDAAAKTDLINWFKFF